uniref:AlNc14C99G5978 protein n=1 Tax=Albugo laibachii Nc14 TaxID=890382 RepID=F0WHB2_9STRA|nr:AlNc14C99G5978 [Albugo laibachii Nc14]|eukprot:CCA20628.1 AlNc14C99G5978 [Albugo laibachii Nc14]
MSANQQIVHETSHSRAFYEDPGSTTSLFLSSLTQDPEVWSGLARETIHSGFVRANFPVEGRRIVAEELDSDYVAEILKSLCLIDTNFSDLDSDDDLSCDESSEENAKITIVSEGEGVDVEMSECYM